MIVLLELLGSDKAMGSLLLNILFVALGAVAGALGGWFLRGSSPALDLLQPVIPEPDPETGVAQVETLMARLHQLTSSVAADIGEHSDRVQEINHQLAGGADVVTIVERLVHANEKMQSQLQAAEKRLQSQAREIESHVKEAHTDPLTRLANRRSFDDELRRCADAYRRASIPFCVMMADVDYFKKFNDTYGHQVGDDVLKGVARVLRREFDGNEVVCRYGGEEFAVIFPGMDLEAAIPRGERGRAAIYQEVLEYEDMDLKVAASAGLAEARPNESIEQLVKRADDSLYVGKSNGRNRGYWHDGETSHSMKDYVSGTAARIKAQQATAALSTGENGVFHLTRGGDEHRVDARDRIAGLSDRDTLWKDLARRLAEQERRKTPIAFLILKIDHFSNLIDGHGAKAAELATRAAAQIVKITKRDMDHAARFEADIFAVLLPGAELHDASAAAERMRLAIDSCKVPVDTRQLQFTASLGVTDLRSGDDTESVLGRAMLALASAQGAGGNQVRTAPDAVERKSSPQADDPIATANISSE